MDETVKAARELWKDDDGALVLMHAEGGHEFPSSVRQAAYTWLDTHLKPPTDAHSDTVSTHAHGVSW